MLSNMTLIIRVGSRVVQTESQWTEVPLPCTVWLGRHVEEEVEVVLLEDQPGPGVLLGAVI